MLARILRSALSALALSVLAFWTTDPNNVVGVPDPGTKFGAGFAFDAARLMVTPASTNWYASVGLAEYGCDGSSKPVATGVRRTLGSHVEYRRTDVTEWYETVPGAVEQGFTLKEGCPRGEVLLKVAVDGLSPRLAANGIDLVDANGKVRLHYTNLSARDAKGRNLPATMSPKDGLIALRVSAKGATYPIVIDPLVWGQQTELTASDGAATDHFGRAVSISGDTAIIGADNNAVVANQQGSAYAFVRVANVWSPQGPALVASDGTAPDHFGSAVSISGDTAVIGAPSKTVGGKTFQGAAYVFVRSGSTWSQQGAALVAGDGDYNDGFGGSVAVSGDTAIIGATFKAVGNSQQQGGAYVFVRSGTAWTQQGGALITADGTQGDHDGGSVTISGDTAVLGAPLRKAGQGGAYVFVRSGTTWSQQGAALGASGGQASLFGWSVSVSGNTAIIGTNGGTGPGTAYLFTRSGTTWSQQGPALVASDGVAGDSFGFSVAIAGDTAVVGANKKNIGANPSQGGAYAFARSGSTWSQQNPPLVANDGAASDLFGNSVSISGSTVIVGASDRKVGANSAQGAAYVFGSGLANGDACTMNTECSSRWCADKVCCNTACSGSCDACSVAAGAIKDGTCGPLPGGSSGAPSCGALACNGTSADCAGCAHDADCSAGHFCAKDGTCKPQKTTGTACEAMAGKECLEASCRVCATGHCVDGICCDVACSGECEACSAALTGGTDGTCKPIPVDTDPSDECKQDPGYPVSCQGDGLCDGMGACRKYAKKGIGCGDISCSQGTTTGFACNGGGTCLPATAQCFPYTCQDDHACRVSCSSDAECASGYVCGTSGKCVPQTGSTCKDEQTVTDGQGKEVSCAPYKCVAGACRMKCASVDDCIAPNFCEMTGQCVTGASGVATSNGDSGSCSCRLSESPEERGSQLWLISVLPLGIVIRRRARHRRATSSSSARPTPD